MGSAGDAASGIMADDAASPRRGWRKVADPVITSTSPLPDGIVGEQQYSYFLTAEGGDGHYEWRIKTMSEIRGTTPTGLSDAQQVRVINPDGQSAVVPGGITFSPSPKPTGILPSTAPESIATDFVITGTDFFPSSRVEIGGVEVPVVVIP